MRSVIKYGLFCVLTFSMVVLTAFGQALPEGKWQLVEYSFHNKIAHPISGIAITMNVDGKGAIGGKSGCNVYGGSYAVDNGKLKITDIISTQMFCDDSSNQFEHDYFAMLTAATAVKLDTGTLTISDAKTKRFLKFTKLKS